MHKQIQIAPGVYVTDFRKQGNLVGLNEGNKKQSTNNVLLLLDDIESLQNKINQLIYSISQIKHQPQWQSDKDYTQAIQQNWQYVIRFSRQMKQKVLRLYELKYYAQSQKMQQLLSIERIQKRENEAIEEVRRKGVRQRERIEKKMGVVVGEGEGENKIESNNNKDKNEGKQQQEGNEGDDDDGGVYV